MTVAESKFQAGDKVILANPKASSGHDLEEGWIGYVMDPNDGSGDIPVQVGSSVSNAAYYYFDEDELELLSASQDKKPDAVNHPKHYAVFEQLEAIEVIASSMTTEQFYGYCLGNILKYRLRAGGKDDVMQELGKADKYQELFTHFKSLCKDAV